MLPTLLDKELLNLEMGEDSLGAILSASAGTVAQKFLAPGASPPSCFSYWSVTISKNLNMREEIQFWILCVVLDFHLSASAYAYACWNFPFEYSYRHEVPKVCVRMHVCCWKQGWEQVCKTAPQKTRVTSFLLQEWQIKGYMALESVGCMIYYREKACLSLPCLIFLVLYQV